MYRMSIGVWNCTAIGVALTVWQVRRCPAIHPGRIRWWILGDRGDTRAGCYLAGWLGVAGRGRSADLGSLLSLAAGSSNAGTF